MTEKSVIKILYSKIRLLQSLKLIDHRWNNHLVNNIVTVLGVITSNRIKILDRSIFRKSIFSKNHHFDQKQKNIRKKLSEIKKQITQDNSFKRFQIGVPGDYSLSFEVLKKLLLWFHIILLFQYQQNVIACYSLTYRKARKLSIRSNWKKNIDFSSTYLKTFRFLAQRICNNAMRYLIYFVLRPSTWGCIFCIQLIDSDHSILLLRPGNWVITVQAG